MGEYQVLVRKDALLYRGLSNPILVRLAPIVGCGVALDLAMAARNNGEKRLDGLLDSDYDGLYEVVADVFKAGGGQVAITPRPPQDDGSYLRFDALMREAKDSLRQVLPQHLEHQEHTLNVEGPLIEGHDRSVESLTENPRVALLYAYGLKLEEGLAGEFIPRHTKPDYVAYPPHVVIFNANTTVEGFDPTSPQTFVKGSGHSLASYLAKRDSEKYLRGIAAILGKPVRLHTPGEEVESFTNGDWQSCLDKAAKKLVAEGVADQQ